MKLSFPFFSFSRLAIATAFFCLWAIDLQAQKFTGKLIAGINGAQIDGDGMSGYYYGGLAAGAGVSFPISEQWSIGPEILYSMKGSRASLDQINQLGYPRIVYRLNYIDLPLVANCQIRPGFSACVGGSVNYLLASKLNQGGNLGFQDVSYLFKKMDYQAMAGLEYEVFDNIWLTGRFYYSVISTNAIGLDNFVQVGSRSRGGFYNNVLQFTLRFRLFGGEEDTNTPGGTPNSQ